LLLNLYSRVHDEIGTNFQELNISTML